MATGEVFESEFRELRVRISMRASIPKSEPSSEFNGIGEAVLKAAREYATAHNIAVGPILFSAEEVAK